MPPRGAYATPEPHPSGARPPLLPDGLTPGHVAVLMDGNGRWAARRGLPRSEGHRAGADVVLEVLAGCLEIGVRNLSLYAFSTENWKRSPDEVRFLMNFDPEVIRRRRDAMDALGVRIRWVGRMPTVWRTVVRELQVAEERTAGNDAMTLYFCVNYGGRAEMADAARAIAAEVAAGRLDPAEITEDTVRAHLYHPDMPDVDLLLRPGGERRVSNYLLWQAGQAQLVFQDVLWPDFDRRHLWQACEEYAQRAGRA
jgi:undecaprenyl diphosphate synthase